MVNGPTDTGDEGDPEEPSRLGAAPTLAVSRQSRRQRRREGRNASRDAPSDASGGSRSIFDVRQRVVLVLVLIVLLAFGPAFFSGLKKTPKNMIGISYGGGPFESAHFQRIVRPGSSLFFNGWFDPLYLYPSDQQNYIISKNPRVGTVRGADSIVAPTADRVQLTYQVAVYFKLNTDLLRQFHEQLGLQYKAYTAKGWNNLLQDTFRQQIENALQEETRRYGVAEIYGNAKLLVRLQDDVQATVSQRLIAALGEPYFCAPTFKTGGKCDPPTFVVKQIDIPTAVVNAFVNVRTSAIAIQTMQNQVLQRKAEAEGIAALNKQLSIAGMNYVLLKAIESGSINFWVLPSNAGVTLTGPSNLTGGTTTTTAPSSGSSSSAGSTTTTVPATTTTSGP